MRLLLTLTLLLLGSLTTQAQGLKKAFKFATFYAAVNGGNSLSDDNVYSLNPNGTIGYDVVTTPFDYSLTLGLRKIARLGYENKENAFYNGTENSFSDAATIGKVKGFEFLFEIDYSRQFGVSYLDQNHFLRYVGEQFIVKIEYVQDGFADINYFESSQRYRYNVNKKLSFNLGAVQRFSEPYGYNPLENEIFPYSNIAINEGYSHDFTTDQWLNLEGEVVANSTEVWREVILPQVLDDYVTQERTKLNNTLGHSLVVGFDYYHYTKTFWLHSWANVMPYHLKSNSEYSYHSFNNNEQWVDYSGGLILGYKVNKHLGLFLEGKYNKYWNRNWHDFSVGANYVIF
tara:strand:+ start:602 stop:1633 length:1032 start_codon:yes stop_codon:yes gene_type:complete